MKNTLAALLAAALMCGCLDSRSMRLRSGSVVHIVTFDLKDADDAAELIADCDRDLAGMARVREYACGRHLDTGRTNVDSAYDVGLVVGFFTEGEYRAYLDDPKHKALVEKWKPRWNSIHIYDIKDKF